MQKDTFFSLIAAGMLIVTLMVSYGSPRLQPDKPQVLPIETLPKQIGVWKSEKDISLDPKVQKVLPTARLLTRVYINPAGKAVELLLLTAREVDDYHDPRVCFPNQGWQISEEQVIQVDNQKMNTLVAMQGREKLDVNFWWVANKNTSQSKNGIVAGLYTLRKAFVRGESTSLFVRLLALQDGGGQSGMKAFLLELQPELDKMTRDLKPSSELRY